jgi:hypothetical protein
MGEAAMVDDGDKHTQLVEEGRPGSRMIDFIDR